MNDFEGYLLLHKGPGNADPLYFTLGDGYLQYYSKHQGKWLGQMELTRHKITVKSIKSPISPHRFIIEAIPQKSQYDTSRIMDTLPSIKLELSGSCKEAKVQWMRAIFEWKRRSWKEPQLIPNSDIVQELKLLERKMEDYGLTRKITQGLTESLKQITKLEVQHIEPTKQPLQMRKSTPFRNLSFHHVKDSPTGMTTIPLSPAKTFDRGTSFSTMLPNILK